MISPWRQTVKAVQGAGLSFVVRLDRAGLGGAGRAPLHHRLRRHPPGCDRKLAVVLASDVDGPIKVLIRFGQALSARSRSSHKHFKTYTNLRDSMKPFDALE